ncbi:MAG: phosphatidylserine decarboxylase family protein [Proteobacteria bacterium]|nr:phosphatidylserine decarboxylase family protein [Pseudomonadota bacterium]
MKKFEWSDQPQQTAYPVAKAGYPFIFSAAFVTLVLALIGFKGLTFAGLLVTLFICFFFRDPDRVIPVDENGIVSPADGKVVVAEVVEQNDFIEGRSMKISIFMSVFNVHVNRIPFSGIVRDILYFPGKFFNANLDKASKDNEHNAIIVETEEKITYAVVQIAGLVARRIVCGLTKDMIVKRGQRFGLICFGSRLDVYLPENIKLNVSVGDTVKSGATILGFMK